MDGLLDDEPDGDALTAVGLVVASVLVVPLLIGAAARHWLRR